jgi:dienelactone hydrolase
MSGSQTPTNRVTKLRRGEALLITAAAAGVSVLVLALVAGGHDATKPRPRLSTSLRQRPVQAAPVTTVSVAKPPAPLPLPRPSVSVGRTILTTVDPNSRRFDVIVRYPIVRGAATGGQGSASVSGPFPLIVFGHGFAVTPEPYSLLLDAWTRAGYVVAAPIFPLENANAPGGPNEKDLVNQPTDMKIVISEVLSASDSGSSDLAHLVDGSHIAVTGQSDGGDTALAAAYDPSVRDLRIGAAMILSGAEDPFAPQFAMPAGGPPLLAVQGTADTINPPEQTYAFYDSASPPKFLLRLVGAGHQPPYTEPGPDLAAVERTTIGFLDSYFKARPAKFDRLLAAQTGGGSSVLTGDTG